MTDRIFRAGDITFRLDVGWTLSNAFTPYEQLTRSSIAMAGSAGIKKSSTKRKFQEALASRKRTKIQHRNADELPWKSVSRPSQTGLGGDDGILELEEVEGVEVVYEETDGGRVVKFNVSEPVRNWETSQRMAI